MKRSLLFVPVVMLATSGVLAAGVDDARVLIESGRYDEAIDMLAPLKKKSPKDSKINYWYGMAALGLGRADDAAQALNVAAERGYTDAFEPLVDIALSDYDMDLADDLIGNWRAALKKARKSEPAALADAESRYVRMSNQLDRVESVPVIAAYTVARGTFDKGLESLDAESLEQGYSFVGDAGVPFFVNNTSREVFWTAPDADGIRRLYTAGVLDDGSREEARELTEYVGQGDIIAPFMMEDGETLYFAARREDSLGGYDIYMTRRDGEGGFYEPSNVGMPYNSPDDDLLYVIDERNNLGWWATNRGVAPDSVTVYVFVPNKERINVDPDDDTVADRAYVSDLELTWPEGFDVKAARGRIPSVQTVKSAGTGMASEFALSLGNGRIVRSIKEFKSATAADTMSEVLRLRRILGDTEERLKTLRSIYGEGNTSIKGDIRQLEAEVTRLRADIANQTNAVIRAERSAR